METYEAKLFLHAPDEPCALSDSYRRAIASADELLIVSAYLTSWDASVGLNSACKRFRMVVGKDFGITRKAACEAVLKWLPRHQQVNFRVADQIDGFHPKAVFWRDRSNKMFAIIGSSNLSVAAFGRNYEANIEVELSDAEYEQARAWVDGIAKLSVPVSADWLAGYKEAVPSRRNALNGSNSVGGSGVAVRPFKLPKPRGTAAALRDRRLRLKQHRSARAGLIELFRNCASGKISSERFYRGLPQHWGSGVGNRFQGPGYERSGKGSDFKALTKSFISILEAPPSDRDDIVSAEIDRLAGKGVPTRGAFLSEMLCLEFPSEYPVLNQPVQRYLTAMKFRAAAGLSEGARYLDLALKLRASLRQNPKHPAKNLAELDSVIWRAYGDTA